MWNVHVLYLHMRHEVRKLQYAWMVVCVIVYEWKCVSAMCWINLLYFWDRLLHKPKTTLIGLVLDKSMSDGVSRDRCSLFVSTVHSHCCLSLLVMMQHTFSIREKTGLETEKVSLHICRSLMDQTSLGLFWVTLFYYYFKHVEATILPITSWNHTLPHNFGPF